MKYCFLKKTKFNNYNTTKKKWEVEDICKCDKHCTMQYPRVNNCGWWMTEDEILIKQSTIPEEFELVPVKFMKD